MIVTAAVRLIVHQERVSADRILTNQAILKDEPLLIAPDQIVFVEVAGGGSAGFIDCDPLPPGAVVIENDVVGDDHVRSGYSARRVTIAHDDAAGAVLENEIVGDHHVSRRMPELNSPALVPVRQVVNDVTTQVRLIDALHFITLDSGIADIVDYVPDHVVVTAAVVGVINPRPSVAGAGRRNVMNVIADGAHERAHVQDAQSTITADIESDYVHVVAGVVPHLFEAGSADQRAPFHVRDKPYASRRRAAGTARYRPVSSRQHVYHVSRLNRRRSVVDGQPWRGTGPVVGIASRRRHIEIVTPGRRGNRSGRGSGSGSGSWSGGGRRRRRGWSRSWSPVRMAMPRSGADQRSRTATTCLE